MAAVIADFPPVRNMQLPNWSLIKSGHAWSSGLAAQAQRLSPETPGRLQVARANFPELPDCPAGRRFAAVPSWTELLYAHLFLSESILGANSE